jgi:hypothetical protein
MGRKAATVEFLERLVDWAGSRREFCDATSIKASNLTSYLNGSKRLSWDRLEKAARHLLGRPPAFKPLVQGNPGLPTLAQVGRVTGVYAFFDSGMRVIYFGKATDLYAEIRQTWNREVTAVRPWLKGKLKFRDVTAYISAYEVVRGDADFRHDVEALGLRILMNSTLNKRRGTFKRTS